MSSEVLNVEVDPLEGGDEVAKAVVARRVGVALLGKRFQRQKAKDGAAIIQVHKDDAVLLGQRRGGLQFGLDVFVEIVASDIDDDGHELVVHDVGGEHI